MENSVTFDQLSSVKELKSYYETHISKQHLRDLLQDESRNSQLRLTMLSNALVDFTHTKIDSQGLALLKKVGE